MKVDVVEIRVGEKIFGVELKNVKHFFEVENIYTFSNLPSYVLGFVNYNNYIYPLISLKKAWNMSFEDNSSTALAIVYKDREIAFLIDEVVKIDSLEKEENFLLEVYKEGEHLIGKLNLDFLENLNFPSFINKTIIEKSIENKKDEYLIFRCNDELLAISPILINKIEELSEKSVINIENSLVKVESFSKIYKDCERKNILILEDEKALGFYIGEIIDLIEVEKLVEYSSGVFDKYFIYQNQEVKVISDNYVKKIINKYGNVIISEEKQNNDLIEVLILDAGIDIAVRMQNVIEIKDYDDLHFTKTIENEHIKGLVSTREGATYLFSLEKTLNKKLELNEESKIIVLKPDNKHIKAILVKEIKDLIYVEKSKIVLSQKNNTFIGGMILNDNTMIPLLNKNWPEVVNV